MPSISRKKQKARSAAPNFSKKIEML